MDLYVVLENLNIIYEEIEHEKVMTVEEAKKIDNMINGVGCKNLFLTDKSKFYLVVLEENKRANIKDLSKYLKCSKLSFAHSEDLKEILSLEVGSVTPLGIINDSNNKVILVIDKDLIDKKLLFHPNINTKTISIYYDDLIKFIDYFKHDYVIY